MYKASHTVSPIRQGWGGSGCLSACVSPLCHHACNYTQKKPPVCVHMHAWQSLGVRVRTHPSVLCVLKPSCRQMGTSGTMPGVSLLKPPTTTFTLLHLAPSPSFPLPLSFAPSAFTKQKESFNLAQTGPTTWLEAVGSSLRYWEETNLAVHLTQWHRQSRERKCRCNIHMKITRLAAM